MLNVHRDGARACGNPTACTSPCMVSRAAGAHVATCETRRTFVQDGVAWTMVKQPCHCELQGAKRIRDRDSVKGACGRARISEVVLGARTRCFSPPDKSSCQLLTVSQPPSRSTMLLIWTTARICKRSSSVTPPRVHTRTGTPKGSRHSDRTRQTDGFGGGGQGASVSVFAVDSCSERAVAYGCAWSWRCVGR